MLRVFSILLFLILFSLQSLADQVPEFLYHWTSNQGLKYLAQSIENGHLTFNYQPTPVDGLGVAMPLIQDSLPFLLPGQVLFTWNHPIGGVGLSQGEIYAGKRDGAESDTTSKVLILKMRKDARVVTIRSNEWSTNRFIRFDSNGELIREPSEPGKGLGAHKLFIPPEIDPKNVDVYKFENWQTDAQGKLFLYFTEWVIINPNSIAEFSADPDLIRKVLKDSAKKKLTPSEIYGGQHNELFSTDTGQAIVNNIVSKTLTHARTGVPQSLINPILPSAKCSQLFSN